MNWTASRWISSSHSLPYLTYPKDFFGMHNCFLADDPAMANLTLANFNQMLIKEKSCMDRLNGGPPLPPPISSIQRVGETPPHALSPHLAPRGDPPSYPPKQGGFWNVIKKEVDNKKSCPGCHYNDPNGDGTSKLKFHLKRGWPVFGKNGFICEPCTTELNDIYSVFKT